MTSQLSPSESTAPTSRSAPEATLVLDAGSRVVAWSPQAEELLGHRACDILNRPFEELLAGSAAGISGGLQRATGTAFGPCPVALCHRDASVLTGQLSATVLLGADEGRQWLVRLTVDRGRGDPDYHAALFDALLHRAPVALAVYDADLRCVLQNSELQRVSGLADEQRLGRTTSETLSGIEGEAVERRQREVLESGLPRTDEVRGMTPADPSHEHVWADSMFPLRNHHGEVFAVAQAILDITERVHARERLGLVTEVGSRLGNTLDLRQTTLDLACATVPLFADITCVHLLEEVFDGGTPAPGRVSPHSVLRCAAVRPELPRPRPGVAAVCGCGFGPVQQRALSTGATMTSVGERGAADEPGGHSHLYVPIVTRGITLGVVTFARGTTREQFEKDDFLLAEEIVARAAVSIDNARRYSRERATALALQRSLLGHPEAGSSAVDVAASYRPAACELGLGGDWYDVIPLSGARVALVTGDVVGHDLPAAAMMGRLRTAVRTLAELDLEPPELLAHLDDAVRRMDDEQSMSLDSERAYSQDAPTAAAQAEGAAGSTCLYAVYDPVSRRCTFASAGHMPPLVLSPSGTAEFADPPVGPPLGLGGPPFESAEVTLPEGTLLVLYTNGLVQQGSGRDLSSGLRQLRLLVSRPQRERTLQEMCRETVDALVPPSPVDDAVLLLARTRALNPDAYATWDISEDPQQVSHMRAMVAEQLERWDLDALQFSTELVVSELVTNVLRYGAQPARLRLIKDRTLICEVSDSSSTSPHLRRARTTDEGGRGLFLVAQLTQAWGTRYSGGGKTIWAEQTLVAKEG
ncbi:SpoIIE family protein phosphatase [Streptomyces sp. NPDC007896]|uniref:ATP-binding SpoIIE family protein phosphatase n=1 Tax=Streptomyces sp. NPDC007896 TaxID=3364784 RepID=UPI0036E978F8